MYDLLEILTLCCMENTNTTKLTWNEIKDIANRLDDIVGNNFYDAMYTTIHDRPSDEEVLVSDEDIMLIKEQLKRIL